MSVHDEKGGGETSAHHGAQGRQIVMKPFVSNVEREIERRAERERESES